MPKQTLDFIKQKASEAKLKLMGNVRLSKEQIAEHIATMLAAHEMTRAKLADTGTKNAVERTWQNYLAFYNRHARDFIDQTNPADLDKLVRMNDGGDALSRAVLQDAPQAGPHSGGYASHADGQKPQAHRRDKRIVCRGLDSVQLELYLVSIGHNLYKYYNKQMKLQQAA